MTTAPEYLLNATQMVVDGQLGQAVATMEAMVVDHAAYLLGGLYQDDIQWLNGQLPELNVDWPLVLPGTLIVERNGHPMAPTVLVLASEMAESDWVRILTMDGKALGIHLSDSDYQEAGQ